MAGAGNASGRGLESADAAEVGGDANGSAAVTADASGGHARGDSRRFAAARSTRRAVQVPRTVGSSMQQVVGLPCHEHFGRVGDSENHCARGFQARDQRRVFFCNGAGAKTRAGFAAHSGDVDAALDADGDTVQRTKRLALYNAVISGLRLFVRARRVDVYVGVQNRVESFDLFEMRIDQLDRGDLAGANVLRHFRG